MTEQPSKKRSTTSPSVQLRLRELISTTPVGARIPSERDLCAEWGIARMTLRRSVDQIVLEGLLERRHGSGTYVLPRPAVRLLGLTSFTTDMKERGMTPSSTTLAFSRGPATPDIAAELAIPVETSVVSFTRLRLADVLPMAIETVWLADASVPGLTSADLRGSFYALLATRYGKAPSSAEVLIEPVIPGPRVREHLGITSSQPCLRITVTSRDSSNQVFMFASCYYRGDRYQLRAELLAGAFANTHRRAG